MGIVEYDNMGECSPSAENRVVGGHRILDTGLWTSDIRHWVGLSWMGVSGAFSFTLSQFDSPHAEESDGRGGKEKF